jgi:hypothetical protein
MSPRRIAPALGALSLRRPNPKGPSVILTHAGTFSSRLRYHQGHLLELAWSAGPAFQLGKKAASPMLDVIVREHPEHGAVPIAPLGQWHRECLPDGRRDAVRIVRIDQQCCFAFLSRASKTRQNKHARIIGILRSHIFLGDEVHSVSQWSHEPDPRGAIEPGKCRVAIGASSLPHRRCR